ncbi:MAG: sugar-binding transcriptional regulator [Lachnospiraceae bacterium]|nr:sugar-binding transcriptional regulator [Lachnospiraceae bacterium]
MRNYEGMSVQERWNLLATVANLYYNSELTQSQIAERLYTSRSKVSRLLKEARKQGVVVIHIQESWARNLDYEKELKERFPLGDVRVVAVKARDKELGLQKIAEAAAYYLDSRIKKNMVVGISWGNTLYRIVSHIRLSNRKNIPITVVPIMGAADLKNPERDAMDLAKDLASAYGGKYRYIYAPLFVKDKKLKDSLVREEGIKSVLELSKRADVILSGIGSVADRSWDHYLGAKTLEILEGKGAVGHIGGHFFDREGQELSTSLSERMVGIRLDDFKNCKNVICAVYGESKAEAVSAALRGGFVDMLVVDEGCAGQILSPSKL